MRHVLFLLLLLVAAPAAALAPSCHDGRVFDDRDGDGRRDRGEPGLPGVKVSDGQSVVATDAEGRYRLPRSRGRTVFVIKPAGWKVGRGADGLPDFWRQGACRDFALQAQASAPGPLRVRVFGDPQPKTATDVDYYARDIVEPLLAAPGRPGDLGLTLGDIVNDDLSLYPAMNRVTSRLPMPWLHAAGNHDLDAGAASDEDSLRTFRATFGPDTLAWEEAAASFVLFDDVVVRPGQKPAYIGGLREDQFAFLEAYLPTLPRERLLVLGAHIPFFDEPEGETFRRADRERLFALLAEFPHVLLLTAHGHVQRHHRHGPADGWNGPVPLHEYNVGAACGAYWSGVKDAQGIPDSMMADGTPNGSALLEVAADATWSLRWQVARGGDEAIGLSAPKVLRQGAYPAWGVYANVYMGQDDSVVEFRVDGGEWRPMVRVASPDPRLLAENARDDAAEALRGYDRSPEAAPSTHLWRGALPTTLAAGTHRVEVRTRDPWRGELRAETAYRLETAPP